jgi:LacI family transcriptional regulator
VAARLKDIASDLNLSVVTVSKVLRNHPDIGPETRRLVLQRMKELNYRPNLAARSLISGRTYTIGLVVPDLMHPFFTQIAKAISAGVRKHGYSLFISSSDDDPELERQEIQQLLARRVDSMLIASTQDGSEDIHRLEAEKIPIILLDRRFPDLRANFVGVDDRVVGELATLHLIQQGCKRIAHVRGPEVSTAIGRMEGYKQALASCKSCPLPEHIISIGASGDHRGERGGYEAATRLLASKVRPDGIFCFNDPVAIGVMRAILEAGVRIPEDIAVVGCGNLSYSDFLRVPLTSVDQDSNAIGKHAAAMAMRLAGQERSTGTNVKLIPPRLIVRASSQRVR